jgi:hypothetical protein
MWILTLCPACLMRATSAFNYAARLPSVVMCSAVRSLTRWPRRGLGPPPPPPPPPPPGAAEELFVITASLASSRLPSLRTQPGVPHSESCSPPLTRSEGNEVRRDLRAEAHYVLGRATRGGGRGTGAQTSGVCTGDGRIPGVGLRGSWKRNEGSFLFRFSPAFVFSLSSSINAAT